MKLSTRRVGILFFMLSGAVNLFAQAPNSQAPPAKAPPSPGQPDVANRISIEVSGGEKNLPVENASVYVKYVEEHVVRRNKTQEWNVKTNRDGSAHVPDAPLGRILIQVIAEGWKTYGRWYDITDAKQTIKIHLERPPKWY